MSLRLIRRAASRPGRLGARVGLEAFALLAGSAPGENVCFSPAGLTQTLALGLALAHGSHRAALASALGVDADDLDRAHAAAARWRRSLLEPDPSVDLILASSLWSDVGLALDPAVVHALRHGYDARASRLDFSEPSAIQAVNDWVRDVTGGAIPEVVRALDPRARLLLVNALHFRGRWKKAFHPDLTRDLTFYASHSTRFPHPMMAASDDYLHFQEKDLEGIALPYGDGRWRMLIFLPSREVPLHDLVSRIRHDQWSRWIRHLRRDRGTIILPRFQLRSSLDLTSVLADLGLSIAQDADGESGGAPDSLTTSSLLQRTRIEVDEQGTRAAAATLMVQVVAWPPPRWQPFHMQVDRPFLFGIEDTATSSLLLLGAMYDPRPDAASRPPGGSFALPPGTPPEITRLSSM